MNAKILCAVIAAIWCTGQMATALDLVMTFDDSIAYVDSQGVDRTHELVGIVEAAKTIWEDIIEDEYTLEITYGWDDLSANTLGVQGKRLSFDTHDNYGGPARRWFIDSTPQDHSEFDFSAGERLYRGAISDHGWITGDVPDALELGYVGRPIRPDQGYDLLTVVLHEIGHWLGVKRNDPYDINPDFVGGAVMEIKADARHLPLSGALMNTTIGPYRELPSAADVFALASTNGWTRIDLPRKDFFGRSGDQQWLNSFNWAGNQVPGARDSAYLRHGGTVRLAAAFTEFQQVSDLVVADGSELFIEERARLKVEPNPLVSNSDGKVTVHGAGTIVVAGNSSSAASLEARSMDIAQASTLSLAGGTIRIYGDFTIDQCKSDTACRPDINGASVISGYGRIEVGNRLNNSGRIAGQAHPTIASQRSLTLIAKNSDSLAWNLSSSPQSGEPGFGQVVASEGDVRFIGGRAAVFHGQMQAENGYSIQFDTATLITAGQIVVRDVSSFIYAPRIENSGSVELDSGGSLRTLQFQNTAGTVHGDGRIVFSDDFTNDDGTIIADQGQTLVLAATARDVHWDLDGSSTDSRWRASNGGRLNFSAAASDTIQIATFGGSLTALNGGSISLNFPAAFEFPVGQSGRIDILGPDSTLVAPNGRLMIGVEDETIGSGVAHARVDQGQINASALYVGGDHNRGIGAAVLELNQGEVRADSELVIWPTGQLRGAGTINADLTNAGMVRIGKSMGALIVNGNYSQDPAGVLAMEISNATMHDRMMISGQASLDGTLEIAFRERPSIGDTFELMDYSSVTGDFRRLDLPPQVRASFTAATGVLVVTSVVPEPSAIRLLLVCCGVLVLTLRAKAKS
jgi:hypothetical protein